jgi:hypothetical protein
MTASADTYVHAVIHITKMRQSAFPKIGVMSFQGLPRPRVITEMLKPFNYNHSY